MRPNHSSWNTVHYWALGPGGTRVTPKVRPENTVQTSFTMLKPLANFFNISAFLNIIVSKRIKMSHNARGRLCVNNVIYKEETWLWAWISEKTDPYRVESQHNALCFGELVYVTRKNKNRLKTTIHGHAIQISFHGDEQLLNSHCWPRRRLFLTEQSTSTLSG